MHLFRRFLCTATVLAAVSVQAQITIGSAPDHFTVTSNNQGQHSIFGQTFATPDVANVQLSAFTLYAGAFTGTIDFNAYIYEWSGSTITGSALYTSPTQTTAGYNYLNLGAFTFNPTSLVLDAAKTYLLLLDPVYTNDSSNGAVGFNDTTFAATSGGRIQGYGTANTALNALSYQDDSQYYDLVFSATFSPISVTPVPEPAMAATVLCGAFVGGLVVRRWWQKRRGGAAALTARENAVA